MQRLAAALLLAALVVLAGCVGGPAPAQSAGATTATERTGTQGPTATAEPTATPEPTASPLPDWRVSLPAGPKEAPDPPTELNRSTVAEYVRTYEYRYVYNTLWFNANSDVEVSCTVEGVANIEAGWRVLVTCHGYSNTRGDAPGTATGTQLHADYGGATYVYYVDADSVIRKRYGD